MVVAIAAFDAVAVRRAKVFETAMFEGMIEVKAPIVGAVVALPMLIVDLWNGVYVAGLPAFGFRLSARFAAGGRRLWNVPLVRARGIPLALVAAL